MFGFGSVETEDIPSTYHPRSHSTCFIPFAFPTYPSFSSRLPRFTIFLSFGGAAKS